MQCARVLSTNCNQMKKHPHTGGMRFSHNSLPQASGLGGPLNSTAKWLDSGDELKNHNRSYRPVSHTIRLKYAIHVRRPEADR